MVYSSATLDNMIDHLRKLSNEQLTDTVTVSAVRLGQLADIIKTDDCLDDHDSRSFVRHALIVAFASRQLKGRAAAQQNVFNIVYPRGNQP